MKPYELSAATSLDQLLDVIGEIRTRPFDSFPWTVLGWHAARLDERASAYVIRDLNVGLEKRVADRLQFDEQAWLRVGFSGRRKGQLMPRMYAGPISDKHREQLRQQDYPE